MRIIASILVATRFAQITAAAFALLILSGVAWGQHAGAPSGLPQSKVDSNKVATTSAGCQLKPNPDACRKSLAAWPTRSTSVASNPLRASNLSIVSVNRSTADGSLKVKATVNAYFRPAAACRETLKECAALEDKGRSVQIGIEVEPDPVAKVIFSDSITLSPPYERRPFDGSPHAAIEHSFLFTIPSSELDENGGGLIARASLTALGGDSPSGSVKTNRAHIKYGRLQGASASSHQVYLGTEQGETTKDRVKFDIIGTAKGLRGIFPLTARITPVSDAGHWEGKAKSEVALLRLQPADGGLPSRGVYHAFYAKVSVPNVGRKYKVEVIGAQSSQFDPVIYDSLYSAGGASIDSGAKALGTANGERKIEFGKPSYRLETSDAESCIDVSLSIWNGVAQTANNWVVEIKGADRSDLELRFTNMHNQTVKGNRVNLGNVVMQTKRDASLQVCADSNASARNVNLTSRTNLSQIPRASVPLIVGPPPVEGKIVVTPDSIDDDGTTIVAVSLSKEPTGVVTIAISGEGATPSAASVSFSRLDYNIPKAISITPEASSDVGGFASPAAEDEVVFTSATAGYDAPSAKVIVKREQEGGGTEEIPTCSGPDDTRECVFASQIASSRVMPGFGADDGVYTNDGALVGAFGTKDRPTDLVFRCLAPEGKECTSPAALPPDMFGVYCGNHLDLLPEDKTSVPSGESVEFTHSTRPAAVYGFALGCTAISSHPFTLQAITYRNRDPAGERAAEGG